MSSQRSFLFLIISSVPHNGDTHTKVQVQTVTFCPFICNCFLNDIVTIIIQTIQKPNGSHRPTIKKYKCTPSLFFFCLLFLVHGVLRTQVLAREREPFVDGCYRIGKPEPNNNHMNSGRYLSIVTEFDYCSIWIRYSTMSKHKHTPI